MSLREKFEEIKNKLRNPEPTVDPSSFDDPVAEQTDWGPLKGGGANFKTHKLYESNFDRIEFKAALGARLFYCVFLFVGLGVMFVPPIVKIVNNKPLWSGFETIFLLLFGLVFASVGGGMYYFGVAPIVFDRRNGYFWKGRTSPESAMNIDTIKHCAKLDEIHALQLISEYCRGNKTSYYSYEMNIVLKNAERINVIDHGKQTTLRKDAQTLANFLNVPVWDAI